MLRYNIYLLLFILIAGCGSPKRIITKYYLIEIPDETTYSSADREEPLLDAYCEIVPVDIYPAYASRQIVNRNKSNEITYYSYHKWAVRPEDSFTRILTDFFDKNRIFIDVSSRFWKVTPSYKIETTVYRLEVNDQADKFNAHLKLEFRLLDNESSELIVQHAADRSESLQEKDINLLASTIGNIYGGELEAFAEKIKSELATKP